MNLNVIITSNLKQKSTKHTRPTVHKCQAVSQTQKCLFNFYLDFLSIFLFPFSIVISIEISMVKSYVVVVA